MAVTVPTARRRQPRVERSFVVVTVMPAILGTASRSAFVRTGIRTPRPSAYLGAASMIAWIADGTPASRIAVHPFTKCGMAFRTFQGQGQDSSRRRVPVRQRPHEGDDRALFGLAEAKVPEFVGVHRRPSAACGC